MNIEHLKQPLDIKLTYGWHFDWYRISGPYLCFQMLFEWECNKLVFRMPSFLLIKNEVSEITEPENHIHTNAYMLMLISRHFVHKIVPGNCKKVHNHGHLMYNWYKKQQFETLFCWSHSRLLHTSFLTLSRQAATNDNIVFWWLWKHRVVMGWGWNDLRASYILRMYVRTLPQNYSLPFGVILHAAWWLIATGVTRMTQLYIHT